MGFPGPHRTVGTVALYCRSFLQASLLLGAILCLGGKEGALATLPPRPSKGAVPAPLELPLGLGAVRTQRRSPGTARSCSIRVPALRARLMPSFLSSWTSPVPEFTEASVAGDWDICGKLQDGGRGRDSSFAAAGVAAEAIRRAAGSEEATVFLRAWEALRSGKCLSLSLSIDRVATLSTPHKYSLGSSFSVAGIWQVRRRPFLPTVLEVELGFPADVPEVILVLQAPLKSGTWLMQVPQVGPGVASLSFSPFFPWKSYQLLVADIKPRGRSPTVDILLQ